MMQWDGTENIQLTNSPDGEKQSSIGVRWKIYFIYSRTQRRQQPALFLNGWVAKRSNSRNVKGELGDYAWSPDSKKIAIAAA